jgi:hypothetical protein
MLTELSGKGGRVCQLAREGKIQCPLIVRPTSEDVVTGNLFGVLSVLNPHWWVPDFLNRALGASRFHRQVFRKFQIELWKNRPHFPRELVPWPEGSTQVDATISWENPPTIVFVEAKYGSDFSPKTAGDNGGHGYSSDQLLRNIRVGLWECGYVEVERLFLMNRRDFVCIALAPEKGHPLVQKYQKRQTLLTEIPPQCRIRELPPLPFVGEISYADIVQILRKQRRWFNRTERKLTEVLIDYLEFKRANRPSNDWSRQPWLHFG